MVVGMRGKDWYRQREARALDGSDEHKQSQWWPTVIGNGFGQKGLGANGMRIIMFEL